MTLNNFQDGSPFSAEGLDAIVNALNHEAIISGGVPSVGTGDYDVDLTACDFVVNGTDYSIGADTVTLSSASASDRVDIVVADDTPQFTVVEGSPATNPNAPDIPDNAALICAVFVDSGATSLVSSDINPYRVVLTRDATTFKGNDIDSDGDGQVDSADEADNADTLDNLDAVQLTGFATDSDSVSTPSGTVSDNSSSTVVNISNSGYLLSGTVFSETTNPPVSGSDFDVIVDGSTENISTQGGSQFATASSPAFRFETSLQIDVNAGANGADYEFSYIID